MSTQKFRRWSFTWCNYTDENVEYLKNIEAKCCDYLVFGFEIGEENGTPHLQGYVEFASPLQQSTVKSRIDPIRKSKSPIHVTPSYKPGEANVRYCVKDETKDEVAFDKWGVYYFEVIHKVKKQGERTDWHRLMDFVEENPNFSAVRKEFPEYALKYASGIDRIIASVEADNQKADVLERFDDVELRDWQVKLKNEVLGKPHERRVIWYYDPKGNAGKSWMKDYLVGKHDAFATENSASRDIAYAYKGQRIAVFDFKRCMDGRVNYGAIEMIKDGSMFSPKYQSCYKMFARPHVVVFANWLPDRSAMSADRWSIREIKADDLSPEDDNCVNTVCNTEPAVRVDCENTLDVDLVVADADNVMTLEEELEYLYERRDKQHSLIKIARSEERFDDVDNGCLIALDIQCQINDLEKLIKMMKIIS